MGLTRPTLSTQAQTMLDQSTIPIPAADDTAGVAGSSQGPSAPQPDQQEWEWAAEKRTLRPLELKGELEKGSGDPLPADHGSFELMLGSGMDAWRSCCCVGLAVSTMSAMFDNMLTLFACGSPCTRRIWSYEGPWLNPPRIYNVIPCPQYSLLMSTVW
ncbi:hypothetical protein NDU88_002433 [Pleurodeles waltl]|uniref:Uncharacterized protein n=1 Tax=Pleurodeles waltl TaxID=8319 RepID=A0AAV7RB01_PLEWA|nr:hypothetical protein NDU88_002433 [Pleurodeles waltl]